jgi:hypothetical protein
MVQEHYRNGEGKAKGIYRTYHENGKLKTDGRYRENQEEAGVWKEYDSKGRLMSRVRYFNDRIVGFEYCASCCRKKNGGYRNLLMLHLGKRTLYFGRCYPDKRNPDW